MSQATCSLKSALSKSKTAAEESFCVHAVFPNYYDGTRVSYSLKAILETMATPAVRTHGYVMTKARHVGNRQHSVCVQSPWVCGYLVNEG